MVGSSSPLPLSLLPSPWAQLASASGPLKSWLQSMHWALGQLLQAQAPGRVLAFAP